MTTEYYDMLLAQAVDEEEMGRWYKFDEYQDWTDSTAIYPEDKALEYVALGLVNEAGEFAGKVKKIIRGDKVSQEALAAELGDVLWYLARACTELEVYMSDVAQGNVDKLTDRKERDVIRGDGDNR